MIEVFKTSVREYSRAQELTLLLQQRFPGSKVSFDLEDCDNILRVEREHIPAEQVRDVLQTYGCTCEVLE